MNIVDGVVYEQGIMARVWNMDYGYGWRQNGSILVSLECSANACVRECGAHVNVCDVYMDMRQQ